VTTGYSPGLATCVSKTVDVARRPWVRIPSLPPTFMFIDGVDPGRNVADAALDRRKVPAHARPPCSPRSGAEPARARAGRKLPRAPGVHCPAEAWPSGRRHTPGKRVGGQLPRGFEPLSLRHNLGVIHLRSRQGGCPLVPAGSVPAGPRPRPAPAPGGVPGPPRMAAPDRSSRRTRPWGMSGHEAGDSQGPQRSPRAGARCQVTRAGGARRHCPARADPSR
jgi:hypothetical protein